MFTGIIEETGIIRTITQSTITVQAKNVLENTKLGDSIAVNGICLTVIDINETEFSANVSKETFTVTNLSDLKQNDYVNLERALTLNTRLGGHIVSGHIDTVGKVVSITPEKEFYNLRINTNGFDNYIVKKGSIAINGISLTIAEAQSGIITIAVIPHTFNNTILKYLKPNDNVNIEFDILAKYVEKNLSTKNNSNITLDFLEKNGFV